MQGPAVKLSENCKDKGQGLAWKGDLHPAGEITTGLNHRDSQSAFYKSVLPQFQGGTSAHCTGFSLLRAEPGSHPSPRGPPTSPPDPDGGQEPSASTLLCPTTLLPTEKSQSQTARGAVTVPALCPRQRHMNKGTTGNAAAVTEKGARPRIKVETARRVCWSKFSSRAAPRAPRSAEHRPP